MTAEPVRYARRRYYAPSYGTGVCGQAMQPEPGTTFSELRGGGFLPPATTWLEPEDREASRRDYAEAEKAARAMPKRLLRELLEESGMHVSSTATKTELVCCAVALHMSKKWPILVVE